MKIKKQKSKAKKKKRILKNNKMILNQEIMDKKNKIHEVFTLKKIQNYFPDLF